jgi:MerR family transcriptional regulator, heat shock protein HspR
VTPDHHPRYSISVAAELTGLHQQTLRVYEARGLVRPRRTPGGTRRYSEADLERLRRVALLTGELGLNLAGATRVLELEEMVAQLDGQIAGLRAQLAAAALQMQAELDRVHRSYRRDLVVYQPPKPPMPWISRS